MSSEAVQSQEAIYYGEEEEVEMTNWEEIFLRHVEETRRLDKIREDQIEKADKKEKSWELHRECTAFLEENETTWILESGGHKLRQKQENKNRRLELSRRQKADPGKNKAKEDR